MDNSSFPRIFDFKNKLLPDKQLLNLKTWFSKYDFTVQHIKGKQNLIPYLLTRSAINKPSLLSSTHIIPIIAMNRQFPFKALNQRSFPMNIPFSSAYQIQDKKFLYRYFLWKTCFSQFSLCLTCSSQKMSYGICGVSQPVLRHITTPEFSSDLLWTLLEWFSPLT